jgi:hypothetical protein
LTSIGASALIEMAVPEAGRVRTAAKVENGILGVSNFYTWIRGIARECAGACSYASATKTKFGYLVILNEIWIVQDVIL